MIRNVELNDNRIAFEMSKTDAQSLYDKAMSYLSKDKKIRLELKLEKRSLDANAALWKMLSLMADALHTTKDELYIEMLARYGKFTHIVVKPEAVEKIKKEWKTIRELGEIEINGKKGIQMQCYYGSSKYNSKEFAVLLDGVIQDAKEIGIEFISKEEQCKMIKDWRKKND